MITVFSYATMEVIIFFIVISVSAILCIFYCHLKNKNLHILLQQLDKYIQENHTVTCIMLLRKHPYLTNEKLTDGYTPFLRACLYGNTQVVKYMLEYCNANVKECTPNKESAFYLAIFDRVRNISSKDASCIHTLYHANADIDATTGNGFTPVQLAALFGHTPLVKWLLIKKVNVNVYPHPYLLAKSQGHYETAMVLKNIDLKALE